MKFRRFCLAGKNHECFQKPQQLQHDYQISRDQLYLEIRFVNKNNLWEYQTFNMKNVRANRINEFSPPHQTVEFFVNISFVSNNADAGGSKVDNNYVDRSATRSFFRKHSPSQTVKVHLISAFGLPVGPSGLLLWDLLQLKSEHQTR